jgi:hypothetical protein
VAADLEESSYRGKELNGLVGVASHLVSVLASGPKVRAGSNPAEAMDF